MSDRAQRNREQYPGIHAALEEVRAIFGPDVQVKHGVELADGRTVGKPVEQRLAGTWVGLADMVIRPGKPEGRR